MASYDFNLIGDSGFVEDPSKVTPENPTGGFFTGFEPVVAPATVSYTHLDVYKRQPRTLRPLALLARAFSIAFRSNPWWLAKF